MVARWLDPRRRSRRASGVGLALACALKLASGLTAQVASDEAAREPTFVRVLDPAGEPLAAAEVTFAGGIPHAAGAARAVDTRTVATDARGRAIARLLPGLCYVGWAVGPVGGDEQRAVSGVHGYFAAGAMFDLRCDERSAPRTFQLVGRDAWSEYGPLRCYALTNVPGVARELQLDEAGRAAVPFGPFGTLEVRTAAGEPLWIVPLAELAALPRPQRVRVRVADERDQPVAGATIAQRVGRVLDWHIDGLRGVADDRMRVLGHTDADGRCTVTVPYRADPLRAAGDDLLLIASADGRADVVGGVLNGSAYVSDRRVHGFDGDELTFTCRSVEPLRGAAAGAPSGTIAQLVAVCPLHGLDNSYLHDARVFTAALDERGRFEFRGVPGLLYSSRLTLVPPPAAAWRAPMFAPEPERALPVDVTAGVAAEREPQPLACGVLELRVVEPNGAPARGGVAFVTAGDRRGVLLRDSAVRVPLDARGAARLDAAAGAWIVVVLSAAGFGIGQVDVETAVTRLELQLVPLAACAVRLVDRTGAPIAGARVASRGTTMRGSDDPANAILQRLRTANRQQWGALRTDADGRVAIPFVPVDGVQQRMQLVWDGGASEQFVLDAQREQTIAEKR